MKKVLLLGDSIRENYEDGVTKLLEDRAEVVHPAENCKFAKYTLCCLNSWLKELGTPDIIHWNNGAWDTCIRFEEDGPFTDVEEYVRNLGQVLRVLRKTGAQVIFATTTPPRDGHANQLLQRTAWYNHQALRLMREEGVDVDDLFSLVLPRRDELICDDFVHLNDAGKAVCARQVAASIEKYL